MKRVLINFVLVIISLAIAYYSAVPAQDFYCTNIGTCTGGFFGFDLGILIWMMMIYSFCTVLLLTVFGGRYKYWLVGVATAPVFIFQLKIDLYHTYLLVVWVLIAWGLGMIANKALKQVVPGFMARIS